MDVRGQGASRVNLRDANSFSAFHQGDPKMQTMKSPQRSPKLLSLPKLFQDRGGSQLAMSNVSGLGKSLSILDELTFVAMQK